MIKGGCKKPALFKYPHMCSAIEMMNRFKSFDQVVTAEELMEQHKEEIIGLNQHQLHEESVDSEGNPLREPYSDRAYYGVTNKEGHHKGYREIKREIRGKEITDLYLTGEFYADMVLRVSNGEYEINSTNDKTEYILKWAAAPIFGLTTENKDAAWDMMRYDFAQRLAYFTGCEIG